MTKIKGIKGKRAMNTAVKDLHGKFGVVEWVQIESTGAIANPVKLSYLIDYGEYKMLSPEKDTVIFNG